MSGWIPTAQGTVNAWECDHMGHMNVQFYIARIADGASHLRAALGLTPKLVRETGRAFVVLEHSLRYRRELHAGDVLRVESGVLEMAEKTATVCYRLWNAEHAEISATSRSVVLSVDLKKRRSVPWSDAQRSNAEALRVTVDAVQLPAYSPPDGIEALDRTDLRADLDAGWIETYRGAANAWECDHLGHFNAQFYVERFSQGAFHLHAALGMRPDWMREHGRGTAALSEHIRYRCELRTGDTMAVLSRPIAVTEKTIRYYNKLYNTASGELSATMDVLDIGIDRLARKATALPPAVRQKAAAMGAA